MALMYSNLGNEPTIIGINPSSGQSFSVSNSQTLNFVASGGITITGTSATRTLTFAVDGTGLNHSLLSNLSADDHTQYALLAGRSGGQTLYGSNLASEDLTLDSTSNGTKGKINANSRVYMSRSSTSSIAFDTLVSGDSVSRFVATADGGLNWGPGNAALDVDFGRISVGLLGTAGALYAGTYVEASSYLRSHGFERFDRLDVPSAATINALANTNSNVKITGSTATALNGISAGVDGQRILIYNGSSASITVSNESGSASAADRFALEGGNNVTIASGGSFPFQYDSAQSRWVPAGGGGGGGASTVTSIGTIDSQTKSANGGVIASNALVFQTADATFPGLVSVGTQTFAGDKTFTGQVTFSGNIVFTSAANGTSGTNATLTAHSKPFIRLTNAGLVSLAAIDTTGVIDGHMVAIHNNTGNAITIVNEYASATAATRIKTGYAQDVVVPNDGTVFFFYEGASSQRWLLATTIQAQIGTIDSQTKSLNGAVISGNTWYMQGADATFPGLVNTGGQTFAGIKTFQQVPVIAGFTTAGVVHTSAGGTLTSSLIVNADVGATAAIAVNKLAFMKYKTTFTGATITSGGTFYAFQTHYYNGTTLRAFNATGFGTLSTGWADSQEVTFIGSSDDSYLLFSNTDSTNGYLTRGDFYLGAGKVITFEYESNLARMVEKYRST